MRRWLLCLFLPFFLSACAKHIWAPDDAVARARYVSPEPPSLTLFTVVNKRSHEGAHSGLMINASQRVLFDPAGTWENPAAPERDDLHYGITPLIKKYYVDYHARVTYDVYEQVIPVSAQVAEMAFQRAAANGPVGDAFCAHATSGILRSLPGFEGISQTMFPKKLMNEVAQMPGVVTTFHQKDSPDDNKALLAAQINGTAVPAGQ